MRAGRPTILTRQRNEVDAIIRHIDRSDIPAVADIAVTSGLFGPDDIEIVRDLMKSYFDRTRDQGHMCLLDVVDQTPVGVAYYQPTPATDGTWTLLMIGVRPAYQNQGRGSALLERVEHDLTADGQRLLLVETSGTPEFESARAFYSKAGYTAEARVRDYYQPGDDMVLFRKALTEQD